MNSFDVVVLGGGPGGMTSGMMLNMMGKTVAIIQQEQDSLGGVCLNRGCMPTKALLKTAKIYREAQQAEKYGLELTAGAVDLERIRAVADADLGKLRNMIDGMFTQATVEIIRGTGSFQSDHQILVTKADGSTATIYGEQIIIATGSESIELPFAPCDGTHILSSDQILQNTELPKKLLIIGGGAIGCEFATLYRSFGAEVILVEALDTLLPREDREAGEALKAAFESQGIKVKTGVRIENLSIEKSAVTVQYAGEAGADRVDKVLVGVGRRSNLTGLNLATAGVETENGVVKVNAKMQSSVPHIYAVGDASGGLMLAHAAEKQGQLLAMNLMEGTDTPLNETAVPRVAFCHPEVAAVGTSKTAKGVKSFTLPQVPNGRSVVDKVGPAFAKLFVEEESACIVGAIMIGEAATEMIHELALAVENRLTLQQIGQTVHAHPTHSTNVVKAVQLFN